MSQKEIDLIQQVDEAKLTPDKHIETKYGLGTIRNLSSGCKTLINIVKHPDKVFCMKECGDNALEVLYGLETGTVYSAVSYTHLDVYKRQYIYGEERFKRLDFLQ